MIYVALWKTFSQHVYIIFDVINHLRVLFFKIGTYRIGCDDDGFCSSHFAIHAWMCVTPLRYAVPHVAPHIVYIQYTYTFPEVRGPLIEIIFLIAFPPPRNEARAYERSCLAKMHSHFPSIKIDKYYS